jgi:hypothetical protein
MFSKGDFYKNQNLKKEAYKNNVILEAVNSAMTDFNGISPLASSVLNLKNVYRINDFHNELVLRKVNSNLRKVIGGRGLLGREAIVSNVNKLISEGVPYRIYRLDVKSFYESFSIDEVLNTIENNLFLSFPTKRILRKLLEFHCQFGGTGLPRGISVSATLSEIMMNSFDNEVKNINRVYFYARYVDDIIIMTNSWEDNESFLNQLENLLPKGLFFSKRKNEIKEIDKIVGYSGSGDSIISFEYLGYKFSVYETSKNNKNFRPVVLDIADRKVAKIKTRIIRSIVDYNRSLNFELLLLRIKYLTANFSIFDKDRERKRLAGIYYNYHQISDNATALNDLDKFLKIAILSGSGNIFSQFHTKTTSEERRKLLNFSFSRGFKNKTFVCFSAPTLKKIQECWKYA